MNKKGFTMIELLATIVVLGLLLSLALTTIFKTIERGRDKTYIADASNMVAQAEYLAKSRPAEIGKPAANGCIVIFLNKFNSDDFSSAPNGGDYLIDSSFVVYKNNYDAATNKTTYEFSGMLIEKTSTGGFRGVELTKGVDLSKGIGEVVNDVSVTRSNVVAHINQVWPNYCQGGVDIK